MSNCNVRTNVVRVKDPEAFKKIVSVFDARIISRVGPDGVERFGFEAEEMPCLEGQRRIALVELLDKESWWLISQPWIYIADFLASGAFLAPGEVMEIVDEIDGWTTKVEDGRVHR